MRRYYKSQTYAAQLIRKRMRSWTWSNDQPTDKAKERMKKWNEYLTELRDGAKEMQQCQMH